MLLLTNRPGSEVARRFRALEQPSSYEYSQLVALALGYDVQVPAARRDRFYVNAVLPFARAGYLDVERREAGRFFVTRRHRDGSIRDEAAMDLANEGFCLGCRLPPVSRHSQLGARQ
jgi:hypothetical protein